MPERLCGLQRLAMFLSAAIVAAVLFASGLAFAAGQSGEMGEAEGGRTHNLPLGDHASNSTSPVQQIAADPVVYTDTRPAKGLSGGEESSDQAADSDIAQPRAILRECQANYVTGGEAPANPQGAVSALRLVVTTKKEIAVINRNDCSTISKLFVPSFFALQFPAAASQSFKSARVIYDFGSQRFFLSAMAVAPDGKDTFFYFAVSTSNTAAAWRIFRIGLKVGGAARCIPTVDGAWGSPNPGVNSRRWLVSGTQSSPQGRVSGSIMSLEKEPTLSIIGMPKFHCFNGLDAYLAPPIVRGTMTTAYFLSVGAVSGNTVRRYALETAGAVVDDTIIGGGPTAINIPAWTAPPEVPQPNGQELFASEGEFSAPTVQVGPFLWNVHTVNVNGKARWRLYKLPQMGTDPLFVFTPSTSLGLHHTFSASVATGSANADAPAFVTFTRVRSGNVGGRPELMMAKGPNSSAAGWVSTMVERSPSQFELAAPGVTCNSDSLPRACRWAEHSSTQMDPANGTRAWGLSELAVGTGQGDWTVRAGQIE